MTHRYRVQVKKKYIFWSCQNCKGYVSRTKDDLLGIFWFKTKGPAVCKDGNERGAFY